MSIRQYLSAALGAALMAVIAVPTHADLFKNFKADGSIETRSFGIDNEVDQNGTRDDYRAETNYRVMVGGSFDLLDDVHGRLELTKNTFQGSGAGSVQDLETSSIFNNAYVKVDKVFGAVDMTVGRQYYGDPNDLNVYFGPQNDDVLSVTSLDAFRADADVKGWVRFQGVAGKINDFDLNGNVPNANSDTDLWGGELNSDKVIPKGNLAAYYYTKQVKKGANVVSGNNTLSVGGLRAAGDIIAGLGYHAELLQDAGRDNGVAGAPAYDGSAYFLGLHYGNELKAMPVRAKLEYGRGSDNFVAIAPSARFGIIWGEHTTVANAPSTVNRGAGSAASLSNLKVADAGIGINPISKLGLDLNWYRFQYDADIGGMSTSAGTEYDFIVSWKHSDNVSFEVNAASFQVGTALQNTVAPTSPITRLGADVKIKF